MKKRHFDVETDGFYGSYWKCKTGSDCAMIAMIGDDPEDYLAHTSVKWLHKLGVNVMTMSPGKKDYGHHNYPLERIEKAINWLKAHGDQKIGNCRGIYYRNTGIDCCFLVKLAFQAARKHPKECRRARLDIDWRVRNAVAKWKRVDR